MAVHKIVEFQDMEFYIDEAGDLRWLPDEPLNFIQLLRPIERLWDEMGRLLMTGGGFKYQLKFQPGAFLETVTIQRLE